MCNSTQHLLQNLSAARGKADLHLQCQPPPPLFIGLFPWKCQGFNDVIYSIILLHWHHDYKLIVEAETFTHISLNSQFCNWNFWLSSCSFGVSNEKANPSNNQVFLQLLPPNKATGYIEPWFSFHSLCWDQSLLPVLQGFDRITGIKYWNDLLGPILCIISLGQMKIGLCSSYWSLLMFALYCHTSMHKLYHN